MYARAIPHHTVADYLAFERASDQKNEFVDGQIIAMAGGSLAHNAITLNIASGLHTRLMGRPCRAFSSDTRVSIEVGDAFFYPDAIVACPPYERRDLSLVAPRVVVEVLSPSTARYDRETKAPLYRSIPTVTDLLLVEQSSQRVEHHRRADGGEWSVAVITEGSVELRALEVALPLAEIYADCDALTP